jgi:hypothetical protein
MRAWYCAAGLLFPRACAWGEEGRHSATLAILYQFEQPNQPNANRALMETQRELDLLTKDAGVRLEWYDRATQAGSSFPNILVLNFLGNCDLHSETKFRGPVHGWLARMHVSDGVILPFGEVNCDLVRALLSDGSLRGISNNVLFGHALARVLAHELYHFITQSTGHGVTGLVKPAFSREDLMMDSLDLDRNELDRLSETILQ